MDGLGDLADAGKPVVIAVKYCGGCNPYYDAILAKESVEKLIGRTLSNWDENAPPDICLLIKQCSSDCFSRPEGFSHHKTFLLEKIEELEETARRISEAAGQLCESAERR